MSQARKYAFETEFAPDGAIVRDAAKRITPEEVEAARKEGYDRGRADALADSERRIAAALEALASAASAVLNRLDAESQAMRGEAARLALAAARKIADSALAAYGAERAAAAIEAAMDTLRHQPRLVVRLPTETAEELKPRINEMCERHGYANAVLLRGEPDLRAGDVIIDWSDGVIAMKPEDAAKRIEDLIEAALEAPATPEAQ
ncbi:MAG: FliH/SctL family protein [Hyphomonadaceae bacterium]